MKGFITFFIISLTTLAACGLLGSDNGPDIPGKIVFAANDEAGTFQIYTMNADGSSVQQLTNFGTDDGAVQPSWSPDGRQIVFSTTLRSSSNGLSLYIMDADGDNMRPMNEREGSPIPTPGNHARWSPGGSQIAFDRCVNCQVGTNIELFIYTFATDSVTQLTETDYPVTNSNPTWSPDGGRIAFVSNRDYVEADSMRFRKDLYVVGADGSGLKRLTNSGNTDVPSWQPRGHFIAYAWQHEDSDIFLYDLNSESIRKLTDLKYVGRPMWSEDGLHLLIPGTTTNDTFVFQYMDTAGEVLKEISIKTNDINGLDWYAPKEN